MARLRWVILILLILLWAIVLAPRLYKGRCPLFAPKKAGCIEAPLYKEKRVAMGTFVEISSAHKEALSIGFSEINRIEKLLSRHDPESEVSKLNASGQLKASPETFYCIKKAIEFYRLSNGAFDITVAPLLGLPASADRSEALKLLGSDKIILDEANYVVKFKLPGMKIDLGAIAKGYTVDCAISKLKSAGINSCLINAGGDISCLGENNSKPWKVALQDPGKKGRLIGLFYLKDRAMATSGDYEQPGHILNPKTGYPAESGVISVSVVASDCTTADALATAIFVTGPERLKELTSGYKGVEAVIIGN